MEIIDDPAKETPEEFLVRKWSLAGRWRMFKRRFWMRGRKKMFGYGFALGLILLTIIFLVYRMLI